MPVFFAGDGNSPVGRTIGMADPHTQGTTSFITLGNSDAKSPASRIEWTTERSIITRLTLSQQCNFQFLHTIGNDVFIYVFGDRIGQITVSGLSMNADCEQSDNEHGFERIMKWYARNRVAKRKEPVVVTIGKTPIQGFVVSLSGDIVDPSTRLMQYSLTLMVLPEKT